MKKYLILLVGLILFVPHDTFAKTTLKNIVSVGKNTQTSTSTPLYNSYKGNDELNTLEFAFYSDNSSDSIWYHFTLDLTTQPNITDLLLSINANNSKNLKSTREDCSGGGYNFSCYKIEFDAEFVPIGSPEEHRFSVILNMRSASNFGATLNSVTYTYIDQFQLAQQETNQKLDQIDDTLTDTTLPDVNGVFDGISEGENQVADLILLPINILRKYTDFTSKACIPYSLDFGIFGKPYTLQLPCINLENYLGSTLWNTIDSLCCFFFVYEFVMLIINAFDSITSFKDTYEGLYQPKHGPDSYQPRHGGD